MGQLGRQNPCGRIVPVNSAPATGIQLYSSMRQAVATGREIDVWSPLYYASQYRLLFWLRADMGITLAGALRATGTTPPAWSITGTSATQVAPYFEIDDVSGGTDLGQAKYKWSMDNGSTFVATGVTTAAGPTALGSTGLSVTQAVGPYNIDNKWYANVSAWADQSGLGNNAVQATAARQPIFNLAAGFGGIASLDYGSVTAPVGLAIPNIAMGPRTVLHALASSGAGFSYAHINFAADTGGMWIPGACRMTVRKGANASTKDIAAWANDGLPKTLGHTCDGSHAGHVAYIAGVARSTTNVATADPGTSETSGTFFIGSDINNANSLRGYSREIMAFALPVPADVMRNLHTGVSVRSGGVI